MPCSTVWLRSIRRDMVDSSLCRSFESRHDEVVAVNHLITATVADEGFDFTASVAGDAPCIRGRVGNQPACQLAPCAVADDDQIAALEPPGNSHNAGRQQASA